MKIQDFDQDLERENYDKVYDIVQSECIELFEKIANLKQMEIDQRYVANKESYLSSIKFEFEKNSATFRDVIILCSLLQEWYCDHSDDILKRTPEERIETYIRVYNRLEFELEEYLKTDEKVKKEGFENLVEQRKKDLINLFKEMLEYKNKKYDMTWDFERWLDQILLYYNYYRDYICEVSDCLRFGNITFDIEAQPVRVNDTEIIIYLEEFYEALIFEGDDYKCNAHRYRDFDLEEGQTLKDLADLEDKKIMELFKEMLDYLNVKYEKTYFTYLKDLVCEHYPYYESSLRFMTSSYYLMNASYIDIIDSMENFYERAKNEYKNHEENMKEYLENKKKEEEALEQLIELENGEIIIDDDLL